MIAALLAALEWLCAVAFAIALASGVLSDGIWLALALFALICGLLVRGLAGSRRLRLELHRLRSARAAGASS